jgi:hypothetical protein
MSFLDDLIAKLGRHQQQAPVASNYPVRNGGIVMPNAAGPAEDDGYVGGPQGPNPMNADIAHLQMLPQLLLQQLAARGPVNLGVNTSPLQGAQNPGYTPLQNSGVGPYGSAVGLQPTMDSMANGYDYSYNPQLNNRSYFYDN